MYILNSARLEKKSRNLLPKSKGNTKLWALPATLYNKFENAKKAMVDAVEDAVAWAKKEGTFVNYPRPKGRELATAYLSRCTTNPPIPSNWSSAPTSSLSSVSPMTRPKIKF